MLRMCGKYVLCRLVSRSKLYMLKIKSKNMKHEILPLGILTTYNTQKHLVSVVIYHCVQDKHFTYKINNTSSIVSGLMRLNRSLLELFLLQDFYFK